MTAPPLRELFVQFRIECEWIRSCYNTYQALWERGSKPIELMRASAQGFFGDLNRLLIEYLYLRICLITDPPTSRPTGGRANLTCQFLNTEFERVKGKPLPVVIKQSTDAMLRLRDFLLPARNRLLAHLDVEDIFLQQDLGAHPQQEAAEFFEAMQVYCDEFAHEVGEDPLDFRTEGVGEGDVIDLMRIVRLGLKAKEEQQS